MMEYRELFNSVMYGDNVLVKPPSGHHWIGVAVVPYASLEGESIEQTVTRLIEMDPKEKVIPGTLSTVTVKEMQRIEEKLSSGKTVSIVFRETEKEVHFYQMQCTCGGQPG